MSSFDAFLAEYNCFCAYNKVNQHDRRTKLFECYDEWLAHKGFQGSEGVTSPTDRGVGEITLTALPLGTAIRAGYEKCDGRSLGIASYPDLYSVIGTTYGTAGGAGTFQVPNLTARIPMGVDYDNTLALGLTTSGTIAGEHTQTLTIANLPAHTHAAGTLTAGPDGAHQHNITSAYATPTSTYRLQSVAWSSTHTVDATENDGNHSHTITGATASTGSANNFLTLSPVMALVWIIKAK